jgi:hypothetical protein
MSNPTIELGGGKWATKPTSLLAYNNHPEWGYNAKEFTVDRNSTATCVGSDGLIKTVQANEARIDYSNDPNGALLVEPQRTNLITWSEDFSKWSHTNLNCTNNIVVPNAGTNFSYSLITSQVNVDKEYTQTFIIKSSALPFIQVGSSAGFDTANLFINVDTVSGEVVGIGSAVEKYSVKKINDLIIIQLTALCLYTNVEGRFFIQGLTANDIERLPVQEYNGADGFTLVGAQLEEASTASSYIPTNGTTVTRLGEIVSKTNLSSEGVLGGKEGTIFFSSLGLKVEGTSLNVFNYIRLYRQLDSYYRFYYTPDFAYISGNINMVNGGKVAIAFDENKIRIYENGVLESSYDIINPPNENVESFEVRTESKVSEELKEIKMFSTALTDQELIDLTTI